MITVVGAGFSGLTLAYHLKKLGLDVRVFERGAKPGGLIQTHETAQGIVETAANAVLSDRDMERLFTDLNVPFAERKPQRKNRYIYWNRPTRWPVSLATTAKLVFLMGQVRLGSDSVMPKESETISEWSERTVNAEFNERLLAPALQGVFAGDPKRLSARLALSSIIGQSEIGKAPSGKFRGSVAPAGGMGQLMSALLHRLEAEDVNVHFDTEYKFEGKLSEPTVICTSAWAAAEITQAIDARLSEQLRHCESLPLVSTTCFFEGNDFDLQGFGCLFPQSQGFYHSGVVFNDCVFEGRARSRSETWIAGGATRLDAAAQSDDQIRENILRDRKKLTDRGDTPLSIQINRWPRAIPHYTVQWEKVLKSLHIPRPLFLHGNYLGSLGLSRIHRRSIHLAEQIKDTYGA